MFSPVARGGISLATNLAMPAACSGLSQKTWSEPSRYEYRTRSLMKWALRPIADRKNLELRSNRCVFPELRIFWDSPAGG